MQSDDYPAFPPDLPGEWFQDADGGFTWWVMDHDGEYYHQDSWNLWAWSDWEMNQFTPEQRKELDEAYGAFESKMRTFTESRNQLHSRNASRGFFPRKGKTKGKGKFGKQKQSSPSFFQSPTSYPSSSTSHIGDVMAIGPNYTGCFICGSKEHEYRDCLSRGKGKGSNNRKGPGVYVILEQEEMSAMAAEAEASSEIPVPLTSPIFEINVARPELEGFGVIDTGATESVASLKSLDRILQLRHERFGKWDQVTVVNGPYKNFKFGNGHSQSSESYILLPQTLGSRTHALGLFTIDSQGVPVLIGIKTLEKLGAILDCSRSAMELKHIDQALVIPLMRSSTGHLLLNLCDDWLQGGSRIYFHGSEFREEKRAEAGNSSGSTAFMVSSTTHSRSLLSSNSLSSADSLSDPDSLYHDVCVPALYRDVCVRDRDMDSIFMVQDEDTILPSESRVAVADVANVFTLEEQAVFLTLRSEEEKWEFFTRVSAFRSMDEHQNHRDFAAFHRSPDSSVMSLRTLAFLALAPAQSLLQQVCHVERWHSQKKARQEFQEGEASQRSQVGREPQADSRDPRHLGPPCHGCHVPAKPGRGSPPGSNKWATWKACEVCHLRLEYTPAYGAPGCSKEV